MEETPCLDVYFFYRREFGQIFFMKNAFMKTHLKLILKQEDKFYCFNVIIKQLNPF